MPEYITQLGRNMIVTDVEKITRANVIDVISKAINVHEQNANAIRYLFEYEKGKQSILNRVKEIREEINNKIVENHAHEIVDFKVGYLLGQPVTYVQRASNDSEDNEPVDDDKVNELNEMLFAEEKQLKDQELGYHFFTCGVAYKLILPNKDETSKSDFKTYVLNPERTFVVYSADFRHVPVLGVTFWVDEDGVKHYTCYSDTHVYKFDSNLLLPYSTDMKVEINGIGLVPIVEYRNDFQRMGAFERVIPLLDALNTTTSDRVNGVEQFIQSLLWLNNVDVELDNLKQLRQYGVIMTHSSAGLSASIEDIKRELDQSSTQSLVDDMYAKILTITSVPARGSTNGGNTGVALMLGESGWQMAEESAQFSENMFREGEIASLRVIKKILEASNNEIFNDLNIADIEIKFNRNKISNLAVKTNALATMINAGIHPRHAIITSDLFSDPQQVWMDSIPYLTNAPQDTELDVVNTDNQLRTDEYVVGGNGVKSVFKRGVDKVQDVNSDNLHHRDHRTPSNEL